MSAVPRRSSVASLTLLRPGAAMASVEPDWVALQCPVLQGEQAEQCQYRTDRLQFERAVHMISLHRSDTTLNELTSDVVMLQFRLSHSQFGVALSHI